MITLSLNDKTFSAADIRAILELCALADTPAKRKIVTGLLQALWDLTYPEAKELLSLFGDPEQ